MYKFFAITGGVFIAIGLATLVTSCCLNFAIFGICILVICILIGVPMIIISLYFEKKVKLQNKLEFEKMQNKIKDKESVE